MATFKVTGKTGDGKAIGGTLMGESISAITEAVEKQVKESGKELASITVKQLGATVGLKISEPRKRNTVATPAAAATDSAAPVAEAAPAVPVTPAPVAAAAPASSSRKR